MCRMSDSQTAVVVGGGLATIQFEMDGSVVQTDHTDFSPTRARCFAEQSHTTFDQRPCRLWVILYPPREFISLSGLDNRAACSP
jgi:hypothetical protein